MLHTKFHGNQPAGSGEDFYRVFTIYVHGGHLGHVTSIMSLDFQISLYLKHSIDSLYSPNSVNVYVPSDNQQFRYKIVRGW